jgi:flagellar biosynthesis GTPase FlhF
MFTYKCQMFLHMQEKAVYNDITFEDKTFYDENVEDEVKSTIAKYDFNTGMLIAMDVARKVEGKGFYPYPVWQGVKDGETTTLKAHKMPNIKVNDYDEIIYTPKSLISTKWKFEHHVEESQVFSMEQIKIEDKKPEIEYIPDSDDEMDAAKNELAELAAEEKEAADKKAAEEKEAADKRAAEERAAAKKKAAEERAAEEKRKAEEEEAKRQEAEAKIILIAEQKKSILEHAKQINVIFDCIQDNKEYIDSLAEKVYDEWGAKKINASHVWISAKGTKEEFDYLPAGVVKDGAIMTDFMTSDVPLFNFYKDIAQEHNLRDDVQKTIEKTIEKNIKRKQPDEEVVVETNKKPSGGETNKKPSGGETNKKPSGGKTPRRALAKPSRSGGSHKEVGGTVARSARKEMPDNIKATMTKLANDSDDDDEETTDSEQ